MTDTQAIHAFKALATTISEDIREFLEDFGFSFFSVRRVYHGDRKMIWLVNNGTFLEGLIQYNIPMTAGTYRHHHEASPNNQGVYLWHETLPPLHLSYINDHQKAFHGITLYNDYGDTCDTMGFAFKDENKSNILSFYASILDNLWHFKKTFFKDNEALFQTLHRDKILLNGHVKKPCDIENLRKDIDKKPVIIKKKKDLITLSQEESLYFTLVQQGETRHDMQHLLKMSSSTLKTHLAHLSHTIDVPFYKMSLIRHE